MSEGRQDQRETLPVLKAADIEQQPAAHRWLVRSLWSRSAVGLIAGHPKVGKSWMGLDLAVSVASGTPCLGRFEVDQPGTALVYLAEDSLPDVRLRIEALCQHRGLDIGLLDLYVIAADYLHLPYHLQALQNTVEQKRPRLLLLDPLVRLHRFNEDKSSEMVGLLDDLRRLQRAFDLALVLVHHTTKRKSAHPGQALRGTGDFWAWADSALYLTRKDDHIQLTTEHRAARAQEPFALQLRSESDGTATHLECLSEPDHDDDGPSLEEKILATLRERQLPARRAELRKNLRVNNQRLGQALVALEGSRLIVRTGKGWMHAQTQRTEPQESQGQTPVTQELPTNAPGMQTALF